MPVNLIESFRNLITPQVIASTAQRLGEPETAVTRGLEAGAGSLLLGLLNKAGDPTTLRDVHALATQAGSAAPGGAPTDLLSAAAPGGSLAGLGGRLLSLVFGGNTGAVGQVVSRATGLSASSGSQLLGMVAPALLGLFAHRIRTDGLSASGLGTMLTEQKDSIRALAPAGLASILGAGGAPSAAAAAAALPKARGAWRWLALAAAVLLGIWLASSRSRAPAPVVATDTSATRMTGVAPAPADTTMAMTAPAGGTLALPGGRTLNVPADGLEHQLVAFITDSSKPVDKTTWFNFDRLLFETGSATLKPESQEQLKDVAAIFAAFPKIRAKVGGYTDNVGKAAANLQLSDRRAKSVMQQLVGLGVAQDRLAAEGYGDQHPVADNSTEQGRAQNRRIALRVTEK